MIETAPHKDKVETPLKQDAAGIGHAASEALHLLGQGVGGVAKGGESAVQHLDFHHAGDIFKSSTSPGQLARAGESSTASGAAPHDRTTPPKNGGHGQNPESATFAASPSAPAPAEATVAAPPLTHMTVPKAESISDFAKGVLGKDAAPTDVARFADQVAKVNHLDPNSMLKPGMDLMAPNVQARTQPHDVPPPAQPTRPGDHPQPAQPTRPGDHPQPAQPARPGDHPQQPHSAHPADHVQPKDSPATTYTVKPGDSLWKIEKQHLGPGASNADILKGVHDLAKANHIPLHTDSHGHVTAMIRPGQKLEVPAGHPLGHRDGPHGHGRPAHPHGDTPPPPAPPAPHRPGDVPPPAPPAPPRPGDVPPPTPPAPPRPGDIPPPTPPKDSPPPAPDKPPPAPEKPPPGGDKPIQPKDTPGPTTPESFNSPEKQQLVKDAEEKYKNQPDKLAEFQSNMKALEDRSAKDHVSPQEVAKTYKEVDRLMEAQGNQPLSPQQRLDLAGQVMKQAGHPNSIDQGQHGTCAINNGIEVPMYTRNPSDAAKLVTDVATTGQYTAKDGTTVKIDPTPHDTSVKSEPADGERSHASEIFQLTAANIRLQKENQSTNPPGQKRYEHINPAPGSGMNDEAIVDYSKNPKGDIVMDNPGINTGNEGQLHDVYKSITGVKDTGTTVVADSNYVGGPNDGVKSVHNEKELNDYLAQCKKDGKFPISVHVDTTSEPFWTDSGSGTAGGSGGGHLVTITDYIPGNPPEVTIHNSWGSSSNHDASNPISSHDLFMAMDNSRNKAADMQQDVDRDRAQGQPDHWKEFEEARLLHATNPVDKNNPAAVQANDNQYEQNLQQAMQRAAQDWAQHPNPAEQATAMKKLNNEIKSLPPDAQKRLKEQERQLGLPQV